MICRSYNEAGCSILSGADSPIFTSDEGHPLRAVANGGELIACERSSNVVTLVDPRTVREHARISSPGGLEGVAFSPDGKTLALGTSVGEVLLWNIPASQHLGRLEDLAGHVAAVRFSSDGRRLAAVALSEEPGPAPSDTDPGALGPPTPPRRWAGLVVWSGVDGR